MAERAATHEGSAVRLPGRPHAPLTVLLQRLLVALTLLTFVALVAYAGRSGYEDQTRGDGVSLLDCFYYATVSITTTGYGDIVPVSDGARMATTLLVTPVRILFLILLVGTTVELLAERTREAIRQRFWRARLKDHTIICGYGTKGRTAMETIVSKGTDRDRIVVIDNDPLALERAQTDGVAAVAGNAAESATLLQAGIGEARAVVVAPNRDDAAVLMTLTARELNPTVTISAAAREADNVHLLHQSGATSVITSSAAAGRLLGHATDAPRLVEVLEDLLTVGEGLDIVERDVGPDDAGPRINAVGDDLLVGVVRHGKLLRFDDPATETLEAGDRILCLCTNAEKTA